MWGEPIWERALNLLTPGCVFRLFFGEGELDPAFSQDCFAPSLPPNGAISPRLLRNRFSN